MTDFAPAQHKFNVQTGFPQAQHFGGAEKIEMKKGRGSPTSRRSPKQRAELKKTGFVPQNQYQQQIKTTMKTYSDMIADPEITFGQKIQIMAHIQAHPEEVLMPQNATMMEDFESLIDSLLLHVFAFSRSGSSEDSKAGGYKQHQPASQF